MKYVLFFLFIFITTRCYSQDSVRANIFLADTRFGEIASIDTIFVYKLPESTLIYMLTPTWSKIPIPLVCRAGTGYAFRYHNIFSQTLTKQCYIDTQKEQQVVLPVDSALSYTENSLAQLGPNESIIVDFYSQGCFHDYGRKLVIRKKGTHFKATLFRYDRLYAEKNPEKPEELSPVNINESAIAVTTLTAEHIKAFIRFENELYAMKDPGQCTTQNSYVLLFKNSRFSTSERSCYWNGFSYLLNLLFHGKKHD